MVKRKSFLASNEKFWVRVLVEAIKNKKQRIGRATRLETGTGWKPVEHFENALRVRPPAPSVVAGSGAGFRRQTVNLFGGGSIPIGHLYSQLYKCAPGRAVSLQN